MKPVYTAQDLEGLAHVTDEVGSLLHQLQLDPKQCYMDSAIILDVWVAFAATHAAGTACTVVKLSHMVHHTLCLQAC